MTATIAPRRIPSSSPVRLRRSCSRIDRIRSSTGITRSLQTIVESAMVSTITIPVAADSPPMNTSSASASCFSAIGSVSTNVSGSTGTPEKCSTPPKATGSTNTFIASMYAGNSQIALAMCFSFTFSTTATWNCRGRNMIASIDSTVSHAQLA